VSAAKSGHPARPPIEAVVVAAGSSSRMGGVDKLDADLGGRTVLRRSVETLAEAGVERMVIVTSPARIPAIAAEPWLPDAVVAVVAGGARRQESVAAGIAALAEPAADAIADATTETAADTTAAVADPVILVHDAARPFASVALVRAIAEATAVTGAAIPVVAVVETLKRIDGELIGATVDRSGMAAAQTPQGVRLSLLLRAYSAYPPDGPETWTDEASLLEACRIPVRAIEGERTNLKVTVPADLDLARTMLAAGLAPGSSAADPRARAGVQGRAGTLAARIGQGIDSHPFGPEGPLVLGGLRIDGAPRLSGHSDGDVALHAVADAMLGAAGLGDLGGLFPADTRTPVGIDSRILLRTVATRVRDAGWAVSNVDLTIVAARPRLGALLAEMAAAIAAELDVDAALVNVKASTGNLDGSEGAGRSISATAVALLVSIDGPAGEARL
jgi:2-C-methyl-D-erythritol 4-phosphate cytidylyltransferase / 2-C-methyl-D-erythritol 2,4-cyclodiphosphate synthase